MRLVKRGRSVRTVLMLTKMPGGAEIDRTAHSLVIHRGFPNAVWVAIESALGQCSQVGDERFLGPSCSMKTSAELELPLTYRRG